MSRQKESAAQEAVTIMLVAFLLPIWLPLLLGIYVQAAAAREDHDEATFTAIARVLVPCNKLYDNARMQ